MSFDDDERAWSERKILESIEDARDALTEYHFKRMEIAASQNVNPDDHEGVLSKWAKLHAYTMRAYKRLRPQIKNHLAPEFWHDAVLYKDDRGRHIVGFKSLERLQDRVIQRSEDREYKHKQDREETFYDVQLLPPLFYDRTIDLMGDAVTELGYVEAPDPPKTVHDLGDPGDGELPEGMPLSKRLRDQDESASQQAAADGGTVEGES